MTVSLWVLPVLFAVTLHEAAHGWVAWRLGDDTAYRLGRVSFNPLRHIDLFGTVLLPAMMLFASGGRMMFGFAKPVPVNFAGLGQPRRDMILVAIAGPGSNLLLAVLSAALLHLLPLLSGDVYQWAGHNLVNSVRINLLLCVFNMLPIPPLDGGRVAVGLLPQGAAMRLARLERSGVLIILFGVFILPWIGGKIGVDLNVFWWFVGLPTEFLMTAVFTLTGHGS
ncbi:MAG: site-2 protease family protein [Alphaproteobacteria bacterium]|nr:site-2 protease family protein [Alphaproteobacteria bacterium]